MADEGRKDSFPANMQGGHPSIDIAEESKEGPIIDFTV